MKAKSDLAVISTLLLCLVLAGSACATSYTLTLYAMGSGMVTPDNTNSSHPSGVNITITAAASNGWYFANWSGDASGSVNPLHVTMNSNLSITGNFLPFPTYSLALVTNGQGQIDLSPPGGGYLSNTLVTATATPADGWVFAGWSGATNSSTNSVSLTLDTNLSLTGTFAQLPAFDVQPVSVSNKAGSTVNFSAHAVGTGPTAYQWYFSGGSLATVTTNTTLTLTNISTAQGGYYWVVATNNYGSATSLVVSLTLTNSIGPTNVVNSPTEASLLTAIQTGGWIGIGFNGTLTLTNTINITNHVVLDGTSVAATISGGNAVRLFSVAPGASFSATNLTLANGSCIMNNGPMGTPADAGAFYNDGGAVVLVGCRLTNNSAQSLISGGLARGGAIFNNGGIVLLSQSVMVSNLVVGGGSDTYTNDLTIGTGLGGAIYNTNGSVTIVGCNFSANLAISVIEDDGGSGTGLAMGGAVFQSSGTMTLVNSSFILNQAAGGATPSYYCCLKGSPAYGGALAAVGGGLSIANCQFATNQAAGGNAAYHSVAGVAYGGAIYCTTGWTVSDSSFLGNQAVTGYGSYNFGNSTYKGPAGFGGAIYNAGPLTLIRTSIYLNQSVGGTGGAYSGSTATGGDGLGGGIFNAGQLNTTNCTIALNSAVGGAGSAAFPNPGYGTTGNALGGGVFNSNATLVAMNLTIASNNCSSPFGVQTTNGAATGFQIANTNGTLRVHNTLIACSGTNNNAYGPITDDGYNICSDGSASLESGSSYNYTDPQLAPFGNYGGPTLCMALLADSPAIDTGDTSGTPATDQRGFVRPFGDGPDIGAFEYGSAPSSVPYLYISSVSGNASLSFAAFPTNLYRLQCSTNLATWIDLCTNGPFTAFTNVTQTVNQPGSSKNCFFRLLVQ